MCDDVLLMKKDRKSEDGKEEEHKKRTNAFALNTITWHKMQMNVKKKHDQNNPTNG